MDLVRRYERKNVDLVADAPDRAPAEEPDPALVEAAIAAFVVLPPVQRSAVVLEDVLGHSLEQTATTMGTTVAAVKAALARARANLATSRSPSRASPPTRWPTCVFRPDSTQPAYFVRVAWEDGRVVQIRDFRYVPHIADGTRFTRA
jgi:hypothetical protein